MHKNLIVKRFNTVHILSQCVKFEPGGTISGPLESPVSLFKIFLPSGSAWGMLIGKGRYGVVCR